MVEQTLLTRIETELPGWKVEGEELVGRWSLPDFGSALAAAVRAGALAERADHHPDMALGWGRLELRLTSHDAGGLTVRDVDLALKVSSAVGSPGGD